MLNKALILFVAAFLLIPLALTGCKGKVETSPEGPTIETIPMTEGMMPTEPATTVANEVIPPTAAPEITVSKPAAVTTAGIDRNMEIQKALKKAGYYAGPVDGKIGPKTKKAIEDFQRDKGLKVDGKVGPRTWAELEKILVE